jgi:uncharacterized membrane protein YhhN
MLPVLAVGFALLESFAVWKGRRSLEFLAKPAVLVVLLIWLYLATGLRAAPFWFALGVLFSLVGDVFLLWADRFFLAGLFAFLMAHTAYLVGFSFMLAPLSIWTLLLALVLGLGAARLLRRILAGVHASRQSPLAFPVLIYGMVITLLLLSALLTLSNTAWIATASLLVALGAFLFYLSDIVLAWNRFIAPTPHGRLLNISLYEAGQILLIAGVILQFA